MSVTHQHPQPSYLIPRLSSRRYEVCAFEQISMGIGGVGLDSALNYVDTVRKTFVG